MTNENELHGLRTAWLAVRLCTRLGLPQQQVDDIGRAARTHDIGKLALPPGLIEKPSALTREERLEVERHCLIGAGLLAINAHADDMGFTTTAVAVALSHHEWWNGSGYPFGLSERSIPRSARIVAVADVFDALTSVRAYKPAWSSASALEYVTLARGVQFDPECVDAFVGLVGALPPDWAVVAEGSAGPRSSRAIHAKCPTLRQPEFRLMAAPSGAPWPRGHDDRLRRSSPRFAVVR
jgi:putative two-component system response regulator